MKKITLIISALILCFVTSCRQEDDIVEFSELVNTKWTTSNWDFSIGDDWVGTHSEVYHIFFYSSTEGCLYYGKKDKYSDVGASSKRHLGFFTYKMTGNKVELTYITEESGWNTLYLTDNNTLSVEGYDFMKGTIDRSDVEWLSTVRGKTGSCTWYSNLNSTLWIIGEGAMADYSSYEATPWAKNGRTSNSLVIKEGVTSVGSYAFANPSIASVEMPAESMQSIGDAAFKGALIESLYLSEGTTSIGEDAFAGCSHLKDINVPSGLVSIGDCAFSGTAMNSYRVDFGSNLRTIGRFAFEGVKISSLTFEEGITSIGAGAFVGGAVCSSSRELVLPNSLTSLGSTAFEGPIQKIVIGSGLEQIGANAIISTVKSGDVYVNRSTPPDVSGNLIVTGSEWAAAEPYYTLHIPVGCKSAYSSKSPWNKFKSTVADETLDGEMAEMKTMAQMAM